MPRRSATSPRRDADRTLELLLEHGINHIDVAASYGDAELRIAKWLQGRPRVLPGHQDRRAQLRAPPREQIRRSLDRLGVDHVDSIQLHNLVDVIEWDIALSPGGALEACDGGARGGPGALHRRHRPRADACPKMHQRSLGRLDFDSRAVPVQLRADAGPALRARRSTELAALCAERNVALQTIKSLAYAPWEGREKTASTWYEPLPSRPTSTWPCSWVLGNPQVFLLTTGDVDVLPKLLDAAERCGRAAVGRARWPSSSSRRCSPDGGGVEQLAHGP